MPVSEHKHPDGFACRQCGNCCRAYNDAAEITLTDEDYDRLVCAGRDDVLAYIDSIPLGEECYIHDGWFHPETGDELYRCPWVRKLPNQDRYICRIYDVRPDMCRRFPQLGQRESALSVGCRGWGQGSQQNKA